MRSHSLFVRFTVVVGLLTACSPIEAGPRLPRPDPVVSVTTTLTPSTTTTLDGGTSMTESCPTQVCLIYTINRSARWSNGRPVTSQDFLATVNAQLSPLARGHDPAYDVVADIDAIDDRNVRVALSQPNGAWQTLFSRLIPEDATGLEPEDMYSTGPFVFDDWVRGDRITLVRNDDWWTPTDPLSGDPRGTIERIEFVFVADTEELLSALESGEVDLASLRPTADLVSHLQASTDTLSFDLAPGPFWEHIDFHHEDEMLSRSWVRDVFDLATDRQKILDQTVRILDPDATALDNTMWMEQAEAYVSHFDDRYRPESAEQMLVDHGCAREEETFVCDGRPMSFVWLSTDDDPVRQVIFETVRDDLAAIGIELIPDMRSPSEFASREVLPAGPDVWQLANFSWKAGSDPSSRDPAYLCDDSDLNVNRYCSKEVEDLVRVAETTMDPEERAVLYNEADKLYLDDLAVIPLYQKPELLVWSADIDGPAPNFTRSTELWNVASWTGTDNLVVALPSEPASLSPLSTSDESANRVLSALLYGAFGMDPSYRQIPVLIDSVEVIEG